MRYLAALTLTLFAATALPQSTNTIAPNQNYTITGFPLFGAVVTQSDTVRLTTPGMIRANAAGAVAAVCVGNDTGNPTANDIVLTLVAGEFFPCIVSYVLDTGTDAITIHIFY